MNINFKQHILYNHYGTSALFTVLLCSNKSIQKITQRCYFQQSVTHAPKIDRIYRCCVGISVSMCVATLMWWLLLCLRVINVTPGWRGNLSICLSVCLSLCVCPCLSVAFCLFQRIKELNILVCVINFKVAS